MNTYNLKNIKAAPSRNGFSLIATLFINDVEVCTMRDAGDGSQPYFDVMNNYLFIELQNDLDKLPELFIEEYGCELKIDVCMFIDLLHYALENKTEFKILAEVN